MRPFHSSKMFCCTAIAFCILDLEMRGNTTTNCDNGVKFTTTQFQYGMKRNSLKLKTMLLIFAKAPQDW